MLAGRVNGEAGHNVRCDHLVFAVEATCTDDNGDGLRSCLREASSGPMRSGSQGRYSDRAQFLRRTMTVLGMLEAA